MRRNKLGIIINKETHEFIENSIDHFTYTFWKYKSMERIINGFPHGINIHKKI